MTERLRVRLTEVAGWCSLALRLHAWVSLDDHAIEPGSLLAAELLAVARILVPAWQGLDPDSKALIRESLAQVVPAGLVADLDCVIAALDLILATEIEVERLHDELPETTR